MRAGDNGTLIATRWDGTRLRVAVGYVGEDGIEPHVWYRAGADGRLERVPNDETPDESFIPQTAPS